ncbi:MAG: hypothetical protein QNJ61_03020 [Desulfobacterales bacterium]|nr:hypothetical protein [Desulfobacterales bacterium]
MTVCLAAAFAFDAPDISCCTAITFEIDPPIDGNRQSTFPIDPHRGLSDGPGDPLDIVDDAASAGFGHGRPGDLAGITGAIDNVACPGLYPGMMLKGPTGGAA